MHSRVFRWFSAAPLVFYFLGFLPLQLIWRIFLPYVLQCKTFTVIWGGTTWTGDFKCREEKTGFCWNISTQTGSPGTLIGWKSGQTTYVPLWDRMEEVAMHSVLLPLPAIPTAPPFTLPISPHFKVNLESLVDSIFLSVKQPSHVHRFCVMAGSLKVFL